MLRQNDDTDGTQRLRRFSQAGFFIATPLVAFQKARDDLTLTYRARDIVREIPQRLSLPLRQHDQPPFHAVFRTIRLGDLLAMQNVGRPAIQDHGFGLGPSPSIRCRA